MSVKKASICINGPELSEIAFGTWRILDAKQSSVDLANQLAACHELGITTIDTAEIYGDYQVEVAVGKALAECPELKQQVEIITKCGINIPSDAKPHAKLPHYNASAENLIHCAEKSLKHLGVEVLDVMLVHRPDWFTPAEETAIGLTRLIDSGKIKYAGVSNYTPSQFALLQSCLDHPLVTNQVEINLLAMDALYDGTLSQCEQAKTRPMAWSALAGGQIFGDSEAAVRIRKAFDQMREKYDNASDDTLATAWVMAHPTRPIAITGSNKIDRIQSQAKAADIHLDRQDWYTLWSAAKGHTVP